jgi:hypothetical protein
VPTDHVLATLSWPPIAGNNHDKPAFNSSSTSGCEQVKHCRTHHPRSVLNSQASCSSSLLMPSAFPSDPLETVQSELHQSCS